jgi:hypothetical protein
MSTYIKKKPTYRRKRQREPLVDGDVESSEAVTHTRIAIPQSDGTVSFDHVLESLHSSTPSERAEPMQFEVPPIIDDWNHEHTNNRSPSPTLPPRKCRVSDDFNI